MEKKYKYKLWLEAERVEVDKDGNEIPWQEHDPGPSFGFDPEPMGSCNTEELLHAMIAAITCGCPPIGITE
jgi:hypothetical protein